MAKRIIMTMALSWLVFFPGAVLAASSDSPALDRTCWKRESCYEYRAKFLDIDKNDKTKLEEGFVTGISAGKCVGGEGKKQWGKCLPAGKTKTEISFGGRAEFANVGEFILVMYKYLVAIASILAVIVIIVSGVQWTASGGNSEIISSSKKRIGGAIVGLFIAYTSFFVLNTINPALVNLRLPQVFLIRPIAMREVELCTDKKFAGKKLALIPRTDASNQELLAGKPFSYPPDSQFGEVTNPACNYAYAVDGMGDEFCFGSFPLTWSTTKEYVCGLSISGGIGSISRVNYDHEVDISGISSNAKSVFLDLIGTDGRAQIGMVQDANLILICKDGKFLGKQRLEKEETTAWWAAQSAFLMDVASTGACVKDGIAISGSCFQHAGSFLVAEKGLESLSSKCDTGGGKGEAYMFLEIKVKKESLGALSKIASFSGLSAAKDLWSLIAGDDPEDSGWVTLGCADTGNEFRCEKILNAKRDKPPDISDAIPLLPILEHKVLFKQIKSVFSTKDI